SSSPSSAWAAPPTQSGCHALKTSWRKPGSVSSAVLTAPPSSRSASRTQTLQPPRERSAAAASELMPLPTTTASYSATREFQELLVRDEASLLRSATLHLVEQPPLLVLGQLEPELLGFDSDRVDAALFAEDDPPLGPDDGVCIRLDRLRLVELCCDRAGLAGEQVLSEHRLERLELVAGQF